MSECKAGGRGELRFLIRGILAWIITALTLLAAASIIFSSSYISSEFLGYFSSAISFFSALAAGLAACRRETKGLIYRALLTGAVITILLLSVGFAYEGQNLKPGGILSVVSFTLSGLLLGAVMSPLIFSPKNNSRFRKKRKN